MSLVSDLLDKSKTYANIDSDYRLAKIIGITHSAVSSYRMGKTLPNEKVLSQLCAITGDDVAVIAAQIQSERSQSPEAKNLWLMVAKRLSGAALTVILSAWVLLGLSATVPHESWAGDDSAHSQNRVSTIYTSYLLGILTVPDFLLVRLRRFAALFWLCLA